MTEEKKLETITSRIWEEVPEDNNPFAAKACYCSGYDVYGDLLGKVSWVEYLYLLFKLEKPSKEQVALLEGLAVALANPGPRDHSVRAAMNAGVGGSTRASALMAALAVGAGNLGGGRELYWAHKHWGKCDRDISAWSDVLNHFSEQNVENWPSRDHVPGFDPNGVSCPPIVLQTLKHLTSVTQTADSFLGWLAKEQMQLESAIGRPLSMVGVAAAAMLDLGFSAEQGEILFLLLRLPGAAAHALEQEKSGWRRYPFFANGLSLVDDPKATDSQESA